MSYADAFVAAEHSEDRRTCTCCKRTFRSVQHRAQHEAGGQHHINMARAQRAKKARKANQ